MRRKFGRADLAGCSSVGSTSRFVFIVRIWNRRDKYETIVVTIESNFAVVEKYLADEPKAVVIIFRQGCRLKPLSGAS